MKCLCATLRRSSRLVTRCYEHELHAAGLTPAQFELLGTLYKRRSIVQADLAEALDVDQTTLSRNIKILMQRDWITRTGSPDDKRCVAYQLSATGKAICRNALPHWQRAQDQMKQLLGKDWKRTLKALDRLTDAARSSA